MLCSEIEYGEIQKKSSGNSAVKLTTHQIAKLVKWIDTTKNAKMYKSMPEYWINLKLRNKTVSYKLRGSLLGERDLYIELRDTAYFPDIYERGEKQPSLFR